MPDDLAPRPPAATAAPPAGPSAGTDWRTRGVRVVRPEQRSADTPETLGMNRTAALSGGLTGATALWAGTNLIRPGEATGAHHHGPLESVIYVVRGRARMRWGERLEWVAEAGPGDFLQVAPWVPHQESNAGEDDLHCVLVRSGPEEVVVNLPDLVAVEEPTPVRWDRG